MYKLHLISNCHSFKNFYSTAVTVTITKADASCTAPTAKIGQVYNGICTRAQIATFLHHSYQSK